MQNFSMFSMFLRNNIINTTTVTELVVFYLYTSAANLYIIL